MRIGKHLVWVAKLQRHIKKFKDNFFKCKTPYHFWAHSVFFGWQEVLLINYNGQHGEGNVETALEIN
jgi:hypothetical protein